MRRLLGRRRANGWSKREWLVKMDFEELLVLKESRVRFLELAGPSKTNKQNKTFLWREKKGEFCQPNRENAG